MYSLAHVLYGTTILSGCRPIGAIDSSHRASALIFSAGDFKSEVIFIHLC